MLTSKLSQLEKRKILVVGDYLLDTYTIGMSERISPEAPVAVVHVSKTDNRPGGAGNVVLNMLSLGADVIAVGRVGDDASGDLVKEALEQAGAKTHFIREKGLETPVKNRVIASGQQIVRIDFETISSLTPAVEEQLIKDLPALLKDVDLVAISDYGKGGLTPKLLQSLIAKAGDIPILTDPKGLDFSRYKGTTLIKPNLGEAMAVSGLGSEASLEEVADVVLEVSGAKALMITRSDEGISLFTKGERQDFPVEKVVVNDVTGAGDTVLAMLAVGMANKIPMSDTCKLSNIAAGIAIQKLGCARVSLRDVAVQLLKTDVDTKLFDQNHLFALQEVLKSRKCSLLGMDSKAPLTPELFRGIRELGTNKDRDLLIYLRDSNPSDEIVYLLASLKEVSSIIACGESLLELCQTVRPEKIFVYKDGVLKEMEDAEHLI